MKILWVCPFFLHPTNIGKQIRTLGTLKELHKRHEVHYAALNDPANTEGPRRSVEYSSKYVAVNHTAPARNSLAIVPQALKSVFHPDPMPVFRYASPELRTKIDELVAKENYDSIVCDFLFAAPNISDLGKAVFFAHDVNTTIWRRHVQTNQGSLKLPFFKMQAAKVSAYEARVCRQSRHVIAVSDIDAQAFRDLAGINTVSSVPTGTDVEYFKPQPGEIRKTETPKSDLVFCGAMDSLPNVDAVEWFLAEVLPLIRKQIPNASFTIAGRNPDPRVVKAAEGVQNVTITGMVLDVRPYLWGGKISVVPIRIGSGTRLKIYECMAAGIPVVSTTIGAEGLIYDNGKDIIIADQPAELAAQCVRLLTDENARQAIANNALARAETSLSWAAVTRDFEAVLEANRLR